MGKGGGREGGRGGGGGGGGEIMKTIKQTGKINNTIRIEICYFSFRDSLAMMMLRDSILERVDNHRRSDLIRNQEGGGKKATR